MSTRADSVGLQDRVTAWEGSFAQKESTRRAADGFFAITELYWLTTREAFIPGLPGRWKSSGDTVTVILEPGQALEHDGLSFSEERDFSGIVERGSIHVVVPEGQSTRGVTAVEIAKRGGQHILRPKSATHPFLAQYEGTRRFDYDPAWEVQARYQAFDTPKPTTVGASVEGIEHIYQAPGVVTFTVNGDTQELLAFGGFSESELLVLFTDETSGDTTYGALRALRFNKPDEGEHTVLDFNEASNLPCAYTDLATCPLPPEGNRITVAVTAGEKKPTQRVVATAEGSGLSWEQIVRID